MLARIDAAEGTYVRCEGGALIVGRPEALGPNGELENDDRLKLKPSGLGRYGVWASLSNGRGEFTQITEDLEDLGPHLEDALLHYLSAWTSPPKPEKPRKPRRGTFGTRR